MLPLFVYKSLKIILLKILSQKINALCRVEYVENEDKYEMELPYIEQ